MFIILLLTIISITSGDNLLMNNSTFRPEPIESVMLDDIEYTFYNYRVTWEEAKIICLGYKSQLVTLDTEIKTVFMTRQLVDSNLDFEELWIGSKKNSRGDWIWDVNDEKLLPNTFFHDSTAIPKYQNHLTENDLQCLAVLRRHNHVSLLIPRRCSEQKPFICEKDAFPTSNIVKVFTVNIDNKILVLYSANATWPEAVFQCRQQGLQIAEISTLTEARSMAVGMLKARPKSIESAWIAGYLNNQVWKWLSSGTKIPQNELWQNNHNSGNCLLLERHICERPRYLSLRCDRRRDFICQMPQEDSESSPIQVTIDNCKYWIMSVPLNWYEANQLCKNFNTTLVSLDSPATVNHIVNIIFDNKELLRHIWIGGKKESGRDNSTKKAVWKWNDTGKAIPGPGQSFVPWCKDSRLFEQNSDCLNLDLEDIDEPIVYGLNCNNKQRYICQEESAACTKMKNKLSPVCFNHSETMSQGNTTTSKLKTIDKFDSRKYINNELTRVYQNSSKLSEMSLNGNVKTKKIFNESSTNDTIMNNENTKNNLTEFHENTNSKPSSPVKNKNFKDIIEYMVKKVNDDRTKAIHNFSIQSLPKISTSQSYHKIANSKQTQMNETLSKTGQVLSMQDNVPKIVQSSMEKKLQNITSTIPFSSSLNLENPVTDIFFSNTKSTTKSTFSPTTRNLFSTQVDRPLQKNEEKLSKPTTSHTYDTNVMFNFGQIMKSTFEKDRINKFDTQESTESTKKKHKVNNMFNNTMRNKNEVSTVRPTFTTNFEKRIQSLKNNDIKNVNDIKVNDLVNAFSHRIHDPNLKQEFLSLGANNVVGSRNNYVSPWNVLVNRIVQSYNNTNKNLIGFKVLEIP